MQFIELLFLSITSVSTEQCQLYATMNIKNHQVKTGQPVILVGQSIVIGEITAEVPAHDEDCRRKIQTKVSVLLC